jgi:hypothetical protein
MRTIRFLILTGCALVPAFAQYVYDYPALLNPYNSSQWTSTGTFSASNNMFTSSSSGNLFFIPTLPSPTSDYEVKTTLTLTASGGDYVTYLRASGTSSVMVTLGNPTFSGSSCTSFLMVAAPNESPWYYSH